MISPSWRCVGSEPSTGAYYDVCVTDLGAHATTNADSVTLANARARLGNLTKEGAKLAAQNKLFVRDRIDLLLDPGSFIEEGLLANALAPGDDLPADGVVTGTGTIDGRPVAVMANDPQSGILLFGEHLNNRRSSIIESGRRRKNVQRALQNERQQNNKIPSVSHAPSNLISLSPTLSPSLVP